MTSSSRVCHPTPILRILDPMQGYNPENPLIVQADRSMFLEVHSPYFEAARAAIAPFAELEKSPEHIHTYRITPLSLWNAASSGLQPQEMVNALEQYAKFGVPDNVRTDVFDLASRWGRIRLMEAGPDLALEVKEGDEALLLELSRNKKIAALLGTRWNARIYGLPLLHRGTIKQALLEQGWPVEDLAGYSDGLELALEWNPNVNVRDYQLEAAESFYQGGGKKGGSGVIVLPPGAGKTVVGMAAMQLVGQRTLILTTNRTSVAQWQRELLSKTSLTPDEVAEYGAASKKLAPVTVATYQMLTARKRGTKALENGLLDPAHFPHLELFRAQDWGLIIYDEVHLLPAPIFRMTAEVQARRRLGLTATLVREDGREGDVFSLIGPKRYDRPWKDLEGQGWIAQAACIEVRLRLSEEDRIGYAVAEELHKFRIAAENTRKREVLGQIVELHRGQPTLIIGQYLEQLDLISQDLETPLITGKTPQLERERLFQAFREGKLKTLVLSKVGNFALDLPDAQVLIQVSGAFGSRQEEAQRLGRLLRPKAGGQTAHFYTLVSRETKEEDFAHHRQLFLAEQGYQYLIQDEAVWLDKGEIERRVLN